MRVAEIKKVIREIPDHPKPGIVFYDLSTVFRDAEAFRSAVDRFLERYDGDRYDAVAGIEARGFLLAAAIAYRAGKGVVLFRKPGKLPAETESVSYDLEYGSDALEVHRDAIEPGQRILVVDDLLATGGTAEAAGRLVERLGGAVHGFAFLVELAFLSGRERLDGHDVFSLIRYE